MNYYAKAIEILESEYDWRAICFEIAKRHPKILVDVIKHDNIDWSKQLEGMNKVSAIKLVRELRGIGLNEAKKFVEEIQQSSGWDWS